MRTNRQQVRWAADNQLSFPDQQRTCEHSSQSSHLTNEITERVEFLNFAYTTLDHDEYMAVILEHRPFGADRDNSR